MSIPPIAKQIGREAVVVLGGAILAALVLRYAPALKSWIKESWN